jgi:DNA polymerase V
MKIKNLGGCLDPDGNTTKVPIFTEKVQVGWPSPADDYVERSIDLNEFLISNTAATYLVRAKGDSMLNVGINDGAVPIVDRSIEPQHGKIVIASIDGSYACKKLQLYPEPKLLSANIKYPPIKIDKEEDLVILGVVTAAINQF